MAPSVTEGPSINGQPSRILLFSSEELRQYEHLPDFVSWADVAFMEKHSYLFPVDNTHRFHGTESFLKEIDALPNSFTFIVMSAATGPNGKSTAESPRMYATISGRPFIGVRDDLIGKEEDKRLHCEARANGVQQWEIKTVVVDSSLQGKGLGKLIMELAEAEFLKRFRAAKLRSVEISAGDESRALDGKQRAKLEGVQVMLTTVREINAGFYTRCGYREWVNVDVPKGAYHGVNEAFSVSWMVKDLGA